MEKIKFELFNMLLKTLKSNVQVALLLSTNQSTKQTYKNTLSFS